MVSIGLGDVQFSMALDSRHLSPDYQLIVSRLKWIMPWLLLGVSDMSLQGHLEVDQDRGGGGDDGLSRVVSLAIRFHEKTSLSVPKKTCTEGRSSDDKFDPCRQGFFFRHFRKLVYSSLWGPSIQ